MPDDRTARLALPLIQPAQAQKHVTHNEALAQLEIAVQPVLEALAATEPPAAPAEGAIWAVGAGATGDWAGRDGRLAMWLEGWRFVTPVEGWRAWDRPGGRAVVHDGTAWVAETVPPPAPPEALPRLGINAEPSDADRLTVAGGATLLTHDGGDHRLKVNKAGPADTASLLFQSGFSGRAEMGLAGSDQFALKVSADGTAFTEALRVERASGMVCLPRGAESLQLEIPYGSAAAIQTPSSGGFVFLSAVSEAFPQAPASAIFSYDTGASPMLLTVWAGGSVLNHGTGTLTGTTNPDGRVSVAAGADGRLLVENRFSAAQTRFSLTFLNGFHPL